MGLPSECSRRPERTASNPIAASAARELRDVELSVATCGLRRKITRVGAHRNTTL